MTDKLILPFLSPIADSLLYYKEPEINQQESYYETGLKHGLMGILKQYIQKNNLPEPLKQLHQKVEIPIEKLYPEPQPQQPIIQQQNEEEKKLENEQQEENKSESDEEQPLLENDQQEEDNESDNESDNEEQQQFRRNFIGYIYNLDSQQVNHAIDIIQSVSNYLTKKKETEKYDWKNDKDIMEWKKNLKETPPYCKQIPYFDQQSGQFLGFTTVCTTGESWIDRYY